MRTLIRNAIQTPDGMVLESRHVHDYIEYVDSTNGKTYIVDGGLDYARRSANGDEIDLNVYSDEPHEVIREALTWGTYGKNGDQPLTYVKLKDMSSEHIRACLEECFYMGEIVREAMLNELRFRNKT